MRDPSVGWKLSPSISEERRLALAQYGSHDELAERLLDDVTVIRAIGEPGRDPGLTDCLQPVFFIDLPNTGDALFNSQHGYRAQYWIDPWLGLAANARLIERLKPVLLAAVDLDDQPKFRKIDLCASLSASSTKLWIREAPSSLAGDVGLEVEPWISEAERGVELARLGTSAPEVSKFEVKGALLDAFGNERVPTRKLNRHWDIHEYGFS